MKEFVRFCLRTILRLMKAKCIFEFDVNNLPKKGVYVAEINLDNSRKEKLYHLLTPVKEAGYTKQEIAEGLEKLFEEVTC